MTTRRNFLAGAAAVASYTMGSRAWATNNLKEQKIKIEAPFSVLQGATNATSTQLSVVIEESAKHSFKLLDSKGNLIAPTFDKKVGWSGSRFAVQKLKYDNLSLGEPYRFQILNGSGQILDEKNLKTLDTSKTNARLALASCMHDQLGFNQKNMWSQMIATKPDMILFMGDTVYVDVSLLTEVGGLGWEDRIWQRHADVRYRFDIYRMKNLIPIVATWDDHDYGLNNATGSATWKYNSRDIFNTFFAQDEVDGFLQRGFGVAFTFNAFGQQFYMMDDRTERTPTDQINGASHWGKEQESWLYETMKKNNRYTWLLNGSQFFGGYAGGESFDLQAFPFLEFKKQIKAMGIPVVLASGDRHYTEVMKIEKEIFGFETFELTTSGVLQLMFEDPWDKFPNKRQLAGVARKQNFMIVDVNLGGALNMKASAVGSKGQSLYTVDLVV